MLLLVAVMVDGRVELLDLADLVVVLTVEHLEMDLLLHLPMAFHPRHRVMLGVTFLVLLLAVLAAVDGEMREPLLVVETETYAQQHLEIPQIPMVDLDLPTLIFILLEVVEQVNINQQESLVDMVVVDLVETLQVIALNLAIMDTLTLEAVEVVEHLTVVDPLVMEEVV